LSKTLGGSYASLVRANIIIIIIFNLKTNQRKKYKYITGKPENPGIIKADCPL